MMQMTPMQKLAGASIHHPRSFREVHQGKWAITQAKFLWDEPDPKLAGNDVPWIPTIFDWKVVAGVIDDPDNFGTDLAAQRTGTA
jgi:hypothetical protein